MATEDNTLINITNERISSGLLIENFGTGQFPINNLELNRGQTYTVALPLDKNIGIELD